MHLWCKSYLGGMQLAVDIGNTRVKAAVFSEREMLEQAHFPAGSTDWIDDWLRRFKPQASILCSTRPYDSEFDHKLAAAGTYLRLDGETPLPFENNYGSPETLGADRVAAVAGGIALYPGKPLLIIDAGTCITLEYYHPDQGYLGGRILPGIDMRFRAMHEFTGALPRITDYPLTYREQLYGNNTRDSLVSGVLEGVAGEMEQAAGRFRALSPELVVLLTGGNAGFFASFFKNEIFAVPELVLAGLNAILLHNAA